jgi:hypothetical protein
MPLRRGRLIILPLKRLHQTIELLHPVLQLAWSGMVVMIATMIVAAAMEAQAVSLLKVAPAAAKVAVWEQSHHQEVAVLLQNLRMTPPMKLVAAVVLAVAVVVLAVAVAVLEELLSRTMGLMAMKLVSSQQSPLLSLMLAVVVEVEVEVEVLTLQHLLLALPVDPLLLALPVVVNVFELHLLKTMTQQGTTALSRCSSMPTASPSPKQLVNSWKSCMMTIKRRVNALSNS